MIEQDESSLIYSATKSQEPDLRSWGSLDPKSTNSRVSLPLLQARYKPKIPSVKRPFEETIRDQSNAAVEVLERNLKLRSLERGYRGYNVYPARKDFIAKNMAPTANWRQKIGSSSKDIDLFAYGEYNRFADPHLKNFHKRKHVISTKNFVP